MTGEPKERLAAALAQAEGTAPLTALRSAIAWAASSLSATIGEADDLAALEAVIALGDAMTDLGQVLRLVPALVEIASPGGPAAQRMAEQQAELGRLTSELDSQRAALESAGDVESRLGRVRAERDELQAQIAMLERQRELADELPGLRAMLGTLREAIDDATASSAEQVGQGLAQAVRTLAELTSKQRTLLGDELAGLADEAVSSGAALAAEAARADELRAEVATRTAEADALSRECQEMLPELSLYRDADQVLADALAATGLSGGTSALDRVRETLGEVRQRLRDLDGALKPLLDQHAASYAEARQARNWSA